MFLATCAITLFCLISVSCSAPLDCEDLIRPVDHVDLHSEDGWALVSITQENDTAFLQGFKNSAAAKVRFSNSSNPGEFLMEHALNFNGTCEYQNTNITLKGNSFFSESCNTSATFLHTSCPDCLSLHFIDSGEVFGLGLYSKRRELEQKELEEFRAQAECLKLDPPVVMDPTKELCPIKTPDQPADQTKEQKN